MQDKELYRTILCLDTAWQVADVDLDLKDGEIRVSVEHPRGIKFACPECGCSLACFDHGEERRWRHLDSCQFKTFLIAKIPRVKCPEHGVKTVSVPWAEGSSRFTLLFERFAIDVLQATQTVKGAMGILNLKWDATWSIVERAVKRGKARKTNSPLPRIGIDVGSKYLWLRSFENQTEAQEARFNAIYDHELDTAKAWGYKEILRNLWLQKDESTATKYFNDWYKRVIHSNLEPMKTLARTIKERLKNVVSYCKHGITNAVAEGMNSKIMSIKRRVGGFRNIENFKTAIFFYCGGLDLDPR